MVSESSGQLWNSLFIGAELNPGYMDGLVGEDGEF